MLFDSEGTWIKKDGNLFGVTMGLYDRVEICELVGLYLLTERAFPNNQNTLKSAYIKSRCLKPLRPANQTSKEKTYESI